MNGTNGTQIGVKTPALMPAALRIVGVGLALLAASVVGYVTGVTPRMEALEKDSAKLQRDVEDVRKQLDRQDRKLDRLLDRKE